MRGDGRDEKCLKLDVGKNKGALHADPSGDGGFTIEIARAAKVVKGVFESELIVRPGKYQLKLWRKMARYPLTLRMLSGHLAQDCSSRSQTAYPREHLLHPFVNCHLE